MKIDKDTVDNIAHLARLQLTEDAKEEMVDKMTNILDWMEKLNELDTEGVEPLIHMSAELNVLREDIALDPLPHAQALTNAPKKDSDYFRVPKVIE